MLFTHFAPRLKTYFIRGGLPAPKAEELAQEAMLLVWRKAAQFDPDRAGAATWIYAIARNQRIDALRRAAQGIPADGLAAPVEEHDDAPLADEKIAAAQRSRELRDAMLGLPEEQMDVLRLAFFDGSTQAEISRRLRLPLGTVKSRMRLALLRLRRAMGEEDA